MAHTDLSHARAPALPTAYVIAIFLVMVMGGIAILVFFFRRLFMAGNLGTASLPLVALVAGVAATFNPCALPALPGFLMLAGSGGASPGKKSDLSLAASLGAVSVVMLLGIGVALVGMEVQDFVAPHFRWVQMAVGAFLIAVAGLHLMRQTERLPLVRPITTLGARVWDGAVAKPTRLGGYLFGAGFVAVGGA